MNLKALWGEVHRRFDPMAPPAEAGWRAPRKAFALEQLHARLNRPFLEKPRVLFAGTIGSGKTTELIALAEERAGRDFAVYFDLHDHLEHAVGDTTAVERLQPWEVVGFIGLAVARAAREALGSRWPKAQADVMLAAWTKLTEPLGDPLTVDLGKLLGTVAVIATGALGGAAAAVPVARVAASALNWRLRVGPSRKRDDQELEVQAFVQAVNALVAQTRACVST